MIKINIKNIEQLVLQDVKVRDTLPEFRHLFDQWLLSYRIPALSNMKKQAMLDLLNSLDGAHLEKLARFFNDMVFVEKLDYHIVKNLEFFIDETTIERDLTNYGSYNNIAISRNANYCYITLWR